MRIVGIALALVSIIFCSLIFSTPVVRAPPGQNVHQYAETLRQAGTRSIVVPSYLDPEQFATAIRSAAVLAAVLGTILGLFALVGRRPERLVEIVASSRRATQSVYETIERIRASSRFQITCPAHYTNEAGDNRATFSGSAAIFMLDPELTSSEAGSALLKRAMSELRKRAAFRMFVVSEPDLGTAALDQLPVSVREELLDTVQLPPRLDLREIEAPLASFLVASTAIRVAERYRAFKAGAAVVLGTASTLFFSICGAILIVYAASVFLNADSQGAQEVAALQIASIAAGGLMAWLNVAALTYFRNLRATAHAYKKPNAIDIGLVFILVAWASHEVDTQNLDAAFSWTGLGVSFGLIADWTRREGLQGLRAMITRGVWARADGHPRPDQGGGMAGYWDEWKRPFRTAMTRPIVLSYSRASPWGVSVAQSLHRQLSEAKLDAFLDEKNIPIGANWRRILLQELSRNSVLICLLDEVSKRSKWVAAEFLAAKTGHALTSMPAIVCVAKSDLDATNANPILQPLLEAGAESGSIDSVRVIRESKETFRVIVAELAHSRYTADRLRGRSPVASLAVPLFYCAGFLGALGFLLWVPALAWAIYEHNSANGARDWLNPVIVDTLCGLLGYLVGFALRAFVVAPAENPRGGRIPALLTLIGLAALLWTWIPLSSAMATGWVVFAFLLGAWVENSIGENMPSQVSMRETRVQTH